MGLMSHLSNAYDAFHFYRVSFYLILILTNMSLMTSLIMKVQGPGLPDSLVYLVRALFYSSKIPLIVFVDCHVMESQNPFVVSVEYFQSEYFTAQKFSSFKFRILNMITVCFCLAYSLKMMARVKLLDAFREDTFHTHFCNAQRLQITFLGRRSINMSVEFIDVVRTTQHVRSCVATWTEISLFTPGFPILL